MRIPISNRLRLCAQMVSPGSRVADIGTDHGYLGIYLLKEQRASYVLAADLRYQPLENAKANAARFSIAEHMDFLLSDGLELVPKETVDTIVCAGMGGDLIIQILAACPWIRDKAYTLILQPQSAGQTLRAYLAQEGFSIEEEALAQDNGFLYTVMKARYGTPMQLSAGQLYATPQLLQSKSELLGLYLRRIESSLAQTVQGLLNASNADPDKLLQYQTAYEEIRKMREAYDESTRYL